MAKGIKKDLTGAMAAVSGKMREHGGGHVAGGLSSEGWNGGYLAALYDVEQALAGVKPDRWKQWAREMIERGRDHG